MIEWKAVSRDVIQSTDGAWKITSKLMATAGIEYKLYRGDSMQGRMECRNNVVDRTETLDEMKGFAERLVKAVPVP